MHWANKNTVAVGLTLVCAALFVFLAGYGNRVRIFAQPLPVASALSSAVQFSRPTDVLRYWQERKFHGRIAVAFTGRWQTVPIRREQLDRVRYPLPIKNIALEQIDKLTDDNFLFVASEVGIIRRLITILPEDGYQRRKDISLNNKTYVEENGTFTLYHEGFAREFSTITSFRPPQEPVLLYIEDSFAPGISTAEIVRQLGATGLMVDSVVLSHEPPSTLPTQVESR